MSYYLITAGEFRYVGKETDRKWEEGDDISILEFKPTEYGRARRVVASEEVKSDITKIGINRLTCPPSLVHG
jgi:hypothetical protein